MYKIVQYIKPYSGSLILLPFVIFFIVNEGRFIFILDHINLLFHEGGHGVFSFFGKFIHALGGSLMQVIIPSLFIFYFFKNGNRFGTQISIVYLTQNLMNISVYVADARARTLPLLGGNKVYHDWYYLLGTAGLLDYDMMLAKLIFIAAIITCIFALTIPAFWKDNKSVSLDLKL